MTRFDRLLRDANLALWAAEQSPTPANTADALLATSRLSTEAAMQPLKERLAARGIAVVEEEDADG